MSTPNMALLKLLGQNNKISKDEGLKAVARQKETGEPLEKVLIDIGASEVDVYQAQADLMQVQFADLMHTKIDPEVRSLLPDQMRERHEAYPVRLDGNKLVVAMADPKNMFALDEMKMRTGKVIAPVLVPPSQFDALKNNNLAALTNGNGNGAMELAPQENTFDDSIGEMLDMLKPVESDPTKKKKSGEENSLAKSLASDDGEIEETELSELMSKDGDESLAEEAPIIRIVNTILMFAIKDGASDIHVEPQRKGVRVRYRIDGVLHEQMKVPQYVLNPLISRIKIMADMNIAERRIPQDGRIHLKMQQKDYDLRVNSCPTAFGEKVVMRILDKSSVLIGLDKLGLYPETQEQLLDICHQPNGCFMICGPTGSGKTTTLYSILNVISTPEKNVMTVEDPVEYQLPGLSQVHVNRKAGLTFASALRAFLRQDPDIIMVGEIRDLETAEIAIQAALTGHLVLSTVHTNDAPSTATRLADMGVEPFLISASLVGSLAQRLARRICSNCKEEYKPPRETLMRFGFDPDQNPDVKFYRGRGCDKCKQTGFKGRLGIYELMRVNEDLADMIVRRASLSELKEAAQANGMKTLQEDGFRKALDGFTTVEEVMRVVFTGGH